jgi:hypothetical protein
LTKREITLSVDNDQIICGTTTISAVAANGNQDISFMVDGDGHPLVSTMVNGAYFLYSSDNLTSYYKNAITVNDDVIKYLSSWAGVNQKAAFLDESCFTRQETGGYEINCPSSRGHPRQCFRRKR